MIIIICCCCFQTFFALSWLTPWKIAIKYLSHSGWGSVQSLGASEERSGAQKATVRVQEPVEGGEEGWELRLFLLVGLWWKKLETNDPSALTASSTQSLATPLSRPRYCNILPLTNWCCKWPIFVWFGKHLNEGIMNILGGESTVAQDDYSRAL